MEILMTQSRILTPLEFAAHVLAEAKLPTGVNDVVGRSFAFSQGLHLIAGTIKSIGYGVDEPLSLYVSTPRFRGIDIRRLERRQNEWVAVSPDGESVRVGELQLA